MTGYKNAAAIFVFVGSLATAAAQTPAPPDRPNQIAPAPKPMDARTAIANVNAWFNHARSLESDFIQLNPDGRQSRGKLYLVRPGKLRFEYDAPSTLEIIADGRSIAVRDRKLGTQDEYFITQTPLKFLLKDPFDLARDTKITDLQFNQDNIAIRVEDSTTFGGTSKIRLVFDPKTFALQQWAVVDPQGFETLVSLYNTNMDAAPDPQLFRIPERERD